MFLCCRLGKPLPCLFQFLVCTKSVLIHFSNAVFQIGVTFLLLYIMHCRQCFFVPHICLFFVCLTSNALCINLSHVVHGIRISLLCLFQHDLMGCLLIRFCLHRAIEIFPRFFIPVRPSGKIRNGFPLPFFLPV